ncbi:hypothetical protein CFN78_03195 [Amycolatopsis antarctica]|uniref:DoxX family protein n=1 Tax=Amycolatopsis antarctica TaxID=1854586 RepID=A0A263D9Y3_9PSEU|nr:hypothetical protein [Amycolatopsis antarctica]OZM75181.1 hypothetical protein CFN78_03195 [Amycolatopsis antarctica]
MAQTSDVRSRRRAHLLAGLLAGAGILHFASPRSFDHMVPKQLPGSRRQWTQASGAAEAGIAAAIAIPRTRRLGGLAAALLFVAVVPGNVKMALDYDRKGKPVPHRVIAWARVPLQWPLIAWALRVRDSA